MLDIKAIREDPEPFRAGLARRNLAMRSTSCSRPTSAAARSPRRVEELRAEQNQASKAIGGAQGDEKQTLIEEVGKVSAELKELEPAAGGGRGRARPSCSATTPNVPHPSAPDGFTDEDARGGSAATASRRRSTSSRGTTSRSASCSACWTSNAARPHQRLPLRVPDGRHRVRAVRAGAPRASTSSRTRGSCR